MENAKKASFEIQFYGDHKEKHNLSTEDDVNKILKELQGLPYEIIEVKPSERKRNSPPPFITSTLQQEASRKLGFGARKTMMIAQQLYEGVQVKGSGNIGLITYMRTDSTRLSEEGIQGARGYIFGRFGKEYISYVQKKNKNTQADAHEAIRPTLPLHTPESLKDSLDRDQFRLYQLIWNRYIASQMAPAVYDVLQVTVESGPYLWKATGSVIKFPGYMALNIEGSDKDEEESGMLPPLTEGEILSLLELIPAQHFTQPPPRFTEPTLIKILEELGIGRPSTYAPIIDTLINRTYIEKDAKRFLPTDLGIVVIHLLKNSFPNIVNVQFTAEMENQLDEIEVQNKDWKEILEAFYGPFKEDLDKAMSELERIKVEDEVSDEICELCGRNMVIKNGRFGKFLACPGYPECKNTKPIVEKLDVPCPKCGDGQVVIKKIKGKKPFYGCSQYPNCDFVSWYKPTGKKCSKCGSFTVQVGKYQRCSNEACVKKTKSEKAEKKKAEE